jgi:hypothetical protein
MLPYLAYFLDGPAAGKMLAIERPSPWWLWLVHDAPLAAFWSTPEDTPIVSARKVEYHLWDPIAPATEHYAGTAYYKITLPCLLHMRGSLAYFAEHVLDQELTPWQKKVIEYLEREDI